MKNGLLKVACFAIAANLALFVGLQGTVHLLWLLGERIGHSFIRNFIVIGLFWGGAAYLFERVANRVALPKSADQPALPPE